MFDRIRMHATRLAMLGSVLLGVTAIVVNAGYQVPPPSERPARSPISGLETKKTIIYFGDHRQPESKRVRDEVFEWHGIHMPAQTSAQLIVRHRKDDEAANIHVVETSEFPHLAKQRKIARFPCWLFLNNGHEVDRRYGFMAPEELLEFWNESPGQSIRPHPAEL